MEQFHQISSQFQDILHSSKPYLQTRIEKATTYLHFLLTLFNLQHAFDPTCKATPGAPSWPSLSQWAHLNDSLSGRLILPTTIGAICHPSHPSFSPLHCPPLQTAWKTAEFHTNDPIST